MPVTYLALSTQFYEALDFEKDARFSDDTTSTMVWSDTITFQLQTHDRFKKWVSKEVVRAHSMSGVLLILSQDTRNDVDALVITAAEAGGKVGTRKPIDMGWLYNRSFEDPDRHKFEAVWFDRKATTAM